MLYSYQPLVPIKGSEWETLKAYIEHKELPSKSFGDVVKLPTGRVFSLVFDVDDNVTTVTISGGSDAV